MPLLLENNASLVDEAQNFAGLQNNVCRFVFAELFSKQRRGKTAGLLSEIAVMPCSLIYNCMHASWMKLQLHACPCIAELNLRLQF
jgi:hypothetical protein